VTVDGKAYQAISEAWHVCGPCVGYMRGWARQGGRRLVDTATGEILVPSAAPLGTVGDVCDAHAACGSTDLDHGTLEADGTPTVVTVYLCVDCAGPALGRYALNHAWPYPEEGEDA
jgi:hypothetical protein